MVTIFCSDCENRHWPLCFPLNWLCKPYAFVLFLLRLGWVHAPYLSVFRIDALLSIYDSDAEYCMWLTTLVVNSVVFRSFWFIMTVSHLIFSFRIHVQVLFSIVCLLSQCPKLDYFIFYLSNDYFIFEPIVTYFDCLSIIKAVPSAFELDRK